MGFKVMELIRGNLFKGGIPEEDVPDIDIKQQSDISDITKDVIAFATSKENVARLNAVERGMYTKEFYLPKSGNMSATDTIWVKRIKRRKKFLTAFQDSCGLTIFLIR